VRRNTSADVSQKRNKKRYEDADTVSYLLHCSLVSSRSSIHSLNLSLKQLVAFHLGKQLNVFECLELEGSSAAQCFEEIPFWHALCLKVACHPYLGRTNTLGRHATNCALDSLLFTVHIAFQLSALECSAMSACFKAPDGWID
jgi:hypothetical protein